MKLHKFTSLAVIAAMTMTMVTMANATDYTDQTPPSSAGHLYRLTNNNNGTFTSDAVGESTDFSALSVDLSGLTDIAYATSVTVTFDIAVSNGNTVMFGIGEKAARGTNLAGSNASGYNTTGLAMAVGSLNGTEFAAYDKKSGSKISMGTAGFDRTVSVTVTLNRVTGKYSYLLKSNKGNKSGSNVATDARNLTVIDAWTTTGGATFMFKNIKVSYTADTGINAAISSVKTTGNTDATLQDFLDGNNISVYVDWYNFTEENKNIGLVISYLDADDHFLGYQHLQFNGHLAANQAKSEKISVDATPTALHGVSGNAGGTPAKVMVGLWDGVGGSALNSPYCDAVTFEAEPAAAAE